MKKNFFGPNYRFLWQNLDFGWLCTAGGTRGSQGVNDLRDIFLFVQILFIWVAFDCKPIFGIQHFSILTRLTRWVPLGFWFLAKFSIFFGKFSKFSNACSTKFYKKIVKSCFIWGDMSTLKFRKFSKTKQKCCKKSFFWGDMSTLEFGKF